MACRHGGWASGPVEGAYALIGRVDAEAELIQRLQRGDDEALRALYDALGRNVHALALRMMGSREDAEEVVQDVFVTLHDAAGRFDPARGSARAWVYTIARNACRMRLRARGARPAKADGHDPHDSGSPLRAGPDGAAPTDRLTVQQAFEGLSSDEARLLSDAFFGGYSYTEIADREGAPVGTIKSRIRRAMHKARDVLTGRGPEAGEGST